MALLLLLPSIALAQPACRREHRELEHYRQLVHQLRQKLAVGGVAQAVREFSAGSEYAEGVLTWSFRAPGAVSGHVDLRTEDSSGRGREDSFDFEEAGEP